MAVDIKFWGATLCYLTLVAFFNSWLGNPHIGQSFSKYKSHSKVVTKLYVQYPVLLMNDYTNKNEVGLRYSLQNIDGNIK